MDLAMPEIWVASMFLMETGTYSPQFRRPYEIQTTGENINQLVNRIDQVTGGHPLTTKVNGNLIAGLSGSLMMPRAVPDSVVYIPNGFNEPRFRFIMQIEVKNRFGNNELYFFQGWSDHFELSYGNHIDDNMLFSINSYARISRIVDYTSPVGGYRDMIVDQAHVIDGRYHTQDASGRYIPIVFGMRPMDLYNGIHSLAYQQALAMDPYGHTLNDTRLSLANDHVRSVRTNDIPSSYIAKAIDASREAQAVAGFGEGAEDIYSRAQASVYEAPLGENTFINALSHITGIKDATSFTLRDLCRIDPTAPQRIHYQPSQARLNQVGDVNGWHAPTLENSLTTMLVNAVHSLMVQYMLVAINFHSTNETIDGSIFTQIYPESVVGFTSADLSQHQAVFVRRFETEVIPDFTLNYLRRYNILVVADLNNDTIVDVSFDGGATERFITPTFADSLLTPVVTVDNNVYNGMVTGIETIANAVGFNGAPEFGHINQDV